MFTIRVGPRFYAQGANPRWYSTVEFATHFHTDSEAHTHALDVLQLEPTDYLVEPCYPVNPRPVNGEVHRLPGGGR
jgi:hypothetical protein